MSDLRTLHEEMWACRRCVVSGFAITPGAIFKGAEGAQVMIIGQAPGVTEVEAGRPFNAGSGRRLFQWLGEAGWAEEPFRSRHYMTSVTKCYPGKANGGKGDRVPSREEQAFCRPFLEREIALLAPRLIIPVGRLAIELFYPRRLRLEQVIGSAAYLSLDALIGTLDLSVADTVFESVSDLPLVEDRHWVVPLPHPSGASLWPNRRQNRLLIARAIRLIAAVRKAYSL